VEVSQRKFREKIRFTIPVSVSIKKERLWLNIGSFTCSILIFQVVLLFMRVNMSELALPK
jgi:hypothetical protein